MQPENQTDDSYALLEEQGALPEQEYQDYQASIATSENEDSFSRGDEELIRWQAAEYIARPKSSKWYLFFAGAVVVLMLLAIFVIKEYSFAVLIPVMAVSLVLYFKRPAPIVSYTLSRKGLHVNERLYPYEDFREFGVIKQANENMITLIPRKRFQMGISFYFDETIGEPIVDILAARLPMKEIRPDFIDRFVRFLGM